MENICNFIYELGQLKKIKHEGWKLIGDKNPESVADHCLRAAQIGYILAELENYDKPQEICTFLVFHDIAECRIGDIHKVANRYIKTDEKEVINEQLEKLGDIGKKIKKIWFQIEKMDTKAGIIAKDADLLEMAVTAKEYIEIGFNSANDWMENISKKLHTKTAKNLLSSIKNSNPNEWWKKLKI